MPIGNITQTVSTIPAPPHRGVDVQSIFVAKQEDFQDHLQGTTVTELNTLKDQLNSRIGEINSTTTTMNGYADTASAGASTATTKAGEASTSASGALTSRNQASAFATNSSNSASKASQWADTNYNVLVEAGKYSAKHWATEAQNVVLNKVDKVTSTDNAIVRFDGTTGAVQNSGVVIDDNGNIGSGTQTFNGFGGSGGFKNKVINGNFCINNYARLPYILTPTTNLYIDCFSGANSGTGTITMSTDTITHNGKDYDAIKSTATTAVSLGTDTRYFTNYTTLEAKNISEISAGGMCLSFLFECSRAGIYSVAVAKHASDGVTINSTYVTSFTATIGSQKVIIPIPTNSFKVQKSNLKGIAIQIGFVTNVANSITSVGGWNIGEKWMKQGSLEWANTIGAYIKVGNIHLEEGLVPSPYEGRLQPIEEILCFRYNKTIGLGAAWRTIGSGGMNTGTNLDITYELPIVMRASPTLTLLGALSSFQILDGVAAYTPTAIYIQDVAGGCVNIRCVYTGGVAGRLAKLITINANSGIRLESAV